MAQPWYEHGLRFECQRCGACCIGDPGVVWVNRDEITALAKFLDMPRAEIVSRYTRRVLTRRSLVELPNGDCVFYDRHRGCKVYAVRPRQCRTWPFWPSNLDSPDAWRDVRAECPGAGRGRLYSLEEITTKLKAIKI